MAANTAPIFTLTPQVKWVESVVTANNTIDLTSGTSYDSNFVGGTAGSLISEIRIKANPANNSAATVLRVWLNNGSTVGTSSNSSIYGELSIPATTTTATAALPDFSYPMNIQVPASYKVYYTIGTAPGGSAEFSITTSGGDY